MSIFDTLGHFFAHLFPHNKKEAQALLTETSPYVNLAGPLVQAVELELKPVLTKDQVQRAEGLNAFLGKYIKKEQDLQNKVNELLPLPTADILRDTAEFLVAQFLPATVDKALLNWVIETAYQLFVVRAAKLAPAPTAA